MACALSLSGCVNSYPAANLQVKNEVPGETLVAAGGILTNPGFENGREGWTYMDWSTHWVDFDISETVARSGNRSAWLKLDRKGPDTRNFEIHGVVQELKPAVFPEIISGYYRVENWSRGSKKQYLQVVIIVWRGNNKHKHYHVRHILTGATEPPHNMGNTHYVIDPKSSIDPVENQWVRFELPVAEEFRRARGAVPTGYEKLVVFFEARYDVAPAAGQHVRADVYFDDLYFGPEKLGQHRKQETNLD